MMKDLFRRLGLLTLLTLLPLFLTFVYGDPPGPPNPGGDPFGGGTPVGGGPVGGPLGDGLGILLTLALVYGCYKLYEAWRSKRAERELY
jgi:hypothetical protein